jgi:type I restriction enzyme, S subunit
MKQWRHMTLQQAGVILIDCVHATPQAVENGYPYVAIPQMKNGHIDFEEARQISVADFASWTKKARPQLHDVVLSRRTNPGVTAVARDGRDFALGQNLVLLRADGKAVLPQFLRWLVRGPIWWQQIEKFMNVGAVFNSLRCADVPKFQLPIPPKAEQENISAILDGLDDKIELNRRMNETLEAMAQAIFRDWFVDFGPTRRKMAGATNPLEIMGGLVTDTDRAQQLADLFPATFGDGGLPEGWSLKPLDESLVLQRGFDLPKSSRTDGFYPVIAASGPSGTHSEFKVSAPGVCTGRSGVLGNVFYVQQDFWPLNTSLWVKAYPNATPIYAYFLLREIDLLALNAGSAVPTLNRNHVHNRPTVTPPMAVVSAYTEIAKLLMVKSDQATKECHSLAATRDLLLPKLMSGEIRIKHAEDMVEAAQ